VGEGVESSREQRRSLMEEEVNAEKRGRKTTAVRKMHI
jgi:hypothetical protein